MNAFDWREFLPQRTIGTELCRHLAGMGTPIRIVDLARRFIAACGASPATAIELELVPTPLQVRA